MWQRALRSWIWRGNLVLALVLGAVCYSALSLGGKERAAPTPPELDLSGRWRPEPSVGRAELEEHIENVRRFHGRERAKPAAVVQVGPSEPPLRAYGVLLFVRDDNGRHGLSLKCKDPSHPRVYHLIAGQSDRGVMIESTRFDAEFGYFDVSRGEERFTFRVPIEGRRGAGIIRTVGDPAGSRATRTATSPLAPLPMRTAKYVPFHDDRGREAGVRITGVKPGSWLAELGVKPGDVLTSWDGNSVLNSRDLLARAERESVPSSVVVKRGVATRNVSTLELRHL